MKKGEFFWELSLSISIKSHLISRAVSRSNTFDISICMGISDKSKWAIERFSETGKRSTSDWLRDGNPHARKIRCNRRNPSRKCIWAGRVIIEHLRSSQCQSYIMRGNKCFRYFRKEFCSSCNIQIIEIEKKSRKSDRSGTRTCFCTTEESIRSSKKWHICLKCISKGFYTNNRWNIYERKYIPVSDCLILFNCIQRSLIDSKLILRIQNW